MTSRFYIHVHKHQYTSKDYVHINHINTQERGGDRQIRPWNRKKSPITNTCIEEHEGKVSTEWWEEEQATKVLKT